MNRWTTDRRTRKRTERPGNGTGFRPLKDTPETSCPQNTHCTVIQSDDERRMTVDEIRPGTCHGYFVESVCRNETRLILDDVRLALDDAGPDRQGDRDICAVDTDVIVVGLSGVIARYASLDGIDTIPRRRGSC